MIFYTGIIGLVFGILFSFYDKKSGSKLYKKWYNISNKDDIDPNLDIGFVTNQLFGQKFTVAIVFTVLAYILHYFLIGEAFYGLFRMIGFFVGIMIAFYTANLLLSVFTKKSNKVIDYIEKVEKEGIDLKAEAKKGFEKAKDKVMETVTGKEEVVEKVIEKEIPKEEVKPDPKKDDNWRDGVKKFMDK